MADSRLGRIFSAGTVSIHPADLGKQSIIPADAEFPTMGVVKKLPVLAFRALFYQVFDFYFERW
jgi:hypothetical protein